MSYLTFIFMHQIYTHPIQTKMVGSMLAAIAIGLLKRVVRLLCFADAVCYNL